MTEKNKPSFKRQDFKLVKFRKKSKWRRPRGLHSKLRLNKAGHQKKPSPGYGSPKEKRNLHPSGFEEVIVSNKNELTSIKDKQKQGVVFKRTLGLKKKLSLIELSKELGLKVLNIKDLEKYIQEKMKMLEERKKQEKAREKKKEKFKKESEKRAEETKKKEEDEDKEQTEKEQKKKVLEGKDAMSGGSAA